MYQFSLVGAKNHYLGLIQTETVSGIKYMQSSVRLSRFFQPYYQPTPAAPAPFTPNTVYYDPTFSGNITSAWGLYVQTSSNILVYGTFEQFHHG